MYKRHLFSLLVVCLAWSHAYAVPENMSKPMVLEGLFEKIKKDPQNLDLNYAYARLAVQQGQYDEALAAYQRMLLVREDLHRVKLDMAMVYAKLNRIDEAEKLLGEVLAIQPPKPVQENIHKLLSELSTRRQRHYLSGSLSMGWNGDSNGNAAPASGNQDILGSSIPLSSSGLESTDDQLFAALNVRHAFRFSGKAGNTWQTEGLYYKTKQSSLSYLDVTVKSLKTGPVWVFPYLNSSLGLSLQYTDTNLEHTDYQQIWRKQMEWTYQLHPQLQLKFSAGHDLKRHHNSARSSLYTLRDGQSWEEKVSALYAYSPKTTFLFNFRAQQEITEAKYYGYNAQEFNGKVFHQLPWYNISAILGAQFVHTEYRDVDVSVNPNIMRVDNQRGWSLILSKPLTENISLTGGYTYKDVTSSIQNYEYENERWTVSLVRKF